MSRVILAAALAGALLTTPALAQGPICGPHDVILQGLADQYQEQVIARGLTNSGGLVEIAATADGATWTMLYSQAGGQTCFISTGNSWQAVTPGPLPGRSAE